MRIVFFIGNNRFSIQLLQGDPGHLDRLLAFGVDDIEITVVDHGMGIAVDATLMKPLKTKLVWLIPKDIVPVEILAVLRQIKIQRASPALYLGIAHTIEASVWQSTQMKLAAVIGICGRNRRTPALAVVSAFAHPQLVRIAAQ